MSKSTELSIFASPQATENYFSSYNAAWKWIKTWFLIINTLFMRHDMTRIIQKYNLRWEYDHRMVQHPFLSDSEDDESAWKQRCILLRKDKNHSLKYRYNVWNEEMVTQISSSNKNKTDIRWLLQLLLLIVTRWGRRNALKIEICDFIIQFRQQ